MSEKIITETGDYVTRDGSRVTIFSLDGKGIFSCKGHVHKMWTGSKRPYGCSIWKPNGRYLSLRESTKDIVAKWLNSSVKDNSEAHTMATKVEIAEFRSDTIDISVHKTTLPEGYFDKMSDKFTTDTTFEASIDNYPIVLFGKHIVYVSFLLYGIEWVDGDYYGCTLVIPDDFMDAISIKAPKGYIELRELEHYNYMEVYNRLAHVIRSETLNPKVYEALADTFSRYERNTRGFM